MGEGGGLQPSPLRGTDLLDAAAGSATASPDATPIRAAAQANEGRREGGVVKGSGERAARCASHAPGIFAQLTSSTAATMRP